MTFIKLIINKAKDEIPSLKKRPDCALASQAGVFLSFPRDSLIFHFHTSH